MNKFVVELDGQYRQVNGRCRESAEYAVVKTVRGVKLLACFDSLEEAKKEFLQVLRQQLFLRKSAVQTAYAIQYRLEKKLGRRFAELTKEEI